MKYDQDKSFPYPVLRPGSSDYVDGMFQATLKGELSKDAQNVKISGRFIVSEPELSKLIDSKQAEYALLVDARETYFRDLVTSPSPTISVEYDGGRISGPVSLLAYIVTTTSVSNFRSRYFNNEYGSRSFNFEPGDVIALDLPREFYVGQEVFANIGTVFDLIEEKELATGKFLLGLDGERIQIRVSPEQKLILDGARGQKAFRPILMSGLYLPVLMQVLAYMARGTEDFEGRKWFRSIQAKCDDLDIDVSPDLDFLAGRAVATKISAPDAKHAIRRGRVEIMSMSYFKESALNDLRSTVAKNLDRYRTGDFLDYFESLADETRLLGGNYDLPSLAKIRIRTGDSELFDVENSILVYEALATLTPSQAREERIWAYLCHFDLLEYVRTRWPIPANDDKAVGHILTHFFAKSSRDLERNNAVSRLWWMGMIAARVDGLTHDEVLRVLMYRSDVRANIIERPTTGSSSNIFSGIIRKLKTSYDGKRSLYVRETFRAFMKEINGDGGVVLLDALSPQRVDKLLESIVSDRLKLGDL